MHKVLGTVPVHSEHSSHVDYYYGGSPEEGAVGCNLGWERLQRGGGIKIGLGEEEKNGS